MGAGNGAVKILKGRFLPLIKVVLNSKRLIQSCGISFLFWAEQR